VNKVFETKDHFLFNDSCVTLLNNSDDNSISTIFADWHFASWRTIYKDVIKLASSKLKVGGNFISVLYPSDNFYIRQKCEELDLTYRDEIFVKRRMSHKINSKTLFKRSLNIIMFSKGPLVDRIWYREDPTSLNRIIDAESMNVMTDVWDKKQFKNGFRSGDDKHKEAMPEWVVSDLIDLTCSKHDNVLDLFGGAGTVMVDCIKKDIKCSASEIDAKNCNTIINRITKNTKLINMAKSLIAKTEDEQHSSTNKGLGLLGRDEPQEVHDQMDQ
jgi:DNA modification methylase